MTIEKKILDEKIFMIESLQCSKPPKEKRWPQRKIKFINLNDVMTHESWANEMQGKTIFLLKIKK